jgi:hypothetical protein
MAITVWAGIGWRGAFFAALSALLLCACNSASEITPPDLNPHATKRVTIRVFAPPSLKIKLKEMWTPNTHPFITSGACDLPGGTQWPIYVPVILKWDGASYVGSFLEDRYLPSKCDWGLFGLVSDTLDDPAAVSYSDFLYPKNPTWNASDRSTEIWCGINPAPNTPRVETCGSLSYFAMFSNHFPPAWRLAVKEADAKFGQDGGMFITPNAKSVELHYRDFDAEARAANGNE